jgi:DNA helicase-2/ATP-dependent DNA helicase PcrA
MAIPITNITAEDRIDDIECHFKVSAGPGAGKTRWLINHIRHVIQKSMRLGNSRKIACITYTNIAAETILERLGVQVERIEVSTIHGFLYKHLIKPFAFLIPLEYEMNIEKMDGHDEVPVYPGILYEWKKDTNQVYLNDDKKIIEALSDLTWQLDANDEIILRPQKPYLGRISKTLSIKNSSYLEYKKMCWRRGILDHDDVLFFSYILINKSPRVLDVIRAKFPYFFIDEFQDTNPIQTYILKKISERETIIGVIGDIAQSIYGFQGARPDHFTNFILPGLKVYSISDNHRCTNKIVCILNAIRSDISQNAQRNIEGISPKFLIGSKTWALDKSCELTGGAVCSLSRDNITSNAMRDKAIYTFTKTNLIDELRENDSNTQRANIIIACIKAIEFARQLRYKEALKELSKELKRSDEEIDIPKYALIILKTLLARYEEVRTKNLLGFYSVVSSIFPIKMSTFRAGAAKTFYENNTVYAVSLSVNVKEDTSPHRTIHKAKGAEFDNVLLVLDKRNKEGVFQESEELGFLIKPDLENNEEHRVRYVAISRAKNCLFINVPALNNATERKLEEMGFELIRE